MAIKTLIDTKNKKIFSLSKLDCESCAAKIEKAISKIENVESVSIIFATKKVSIEIGGGKWEDVIKEAQNTIDHIEPSISLLENSKENVHSNLEEELSSRNKWIMLGLGALLFLIGIIFHFSIGLELLIYLISYFLVGGEVLLKAFRNGIRGQVFDENFLMTIATIGAFLISEFPEAVAVMLFYQIGEFFQELAVNHSRKSISALMDLKPDFANRIVGNSEVKVAPDQIKIGDMIIVKPGEKIPLDGRIIEGKSMVSTSALTGESLPRQLGPGKEVLAGFINTSGVLRIKVSKEFGESTVAKVLELVENASSRKAPTENFISKFARYYTPLVVLTALIIAFFPPLLMTGEEFSVWIYRALVFLVISCPCALVVSIPLGFFGGIGCASKNGILVKGGNYLEALNKLDTLVFDKTGTLTKGVFKVTKIIPQNGFDKNELLKYAAYAETYSNHPIARSILSEFNGEVNKDKISNYKELLGCGIRVIVEDKQVLIGNDQLMNSERIFYSSVEEVGTILHVAIDKQYAGFILISDEEKEDAKRAISELKTLGIRKLVMLTGDGKKIGQKIAEDLGIDEVYTELLPDQKVEKLEILEKWKWPNGKIAFVGDGINDAPVIGRADNGIAMGGLGSDAAIEAADIVIMTDQPSKIVNAIKIAKRTRKIVWQNIGIALIVKGMVLLLGAYGIATMWEAVFADVGVAIIAIMNAMRLMGNKE